MRLPFTAAVVVVMLAVGVVTAALWRAAEEAGWYPYLAYGAPSFAQGRWWTLVTGPFLAVAPWAYPPMVGSFALCAGWAERVLGSRRAALTLSGVQVAAALAAAGILHLLARTGWPWAVVAAGERDVGFSAGALGILAVLLERVSRHRRAWARTALALYVSLSLVFIGGLADVGHFVAVSAGLVAAPYLASRVGATDAAAAPVPRRAPLVRAATTALVAVSAGLVLGAVAPTAGPVGDTAHPSVRLLGAAVAVALTAALVARPRRTD